MALYAMSEIAFVGGSLVPTGGHNLLEPASLGIPFLFGPYMTNFREMTALVLEYQAGMQVENMTELSDKIEALLQNKDMQKRVGNNGLVMMRDNGGATEKHMNVIRINLRQ